MYFYEKKCWWYVLVSYKNIKVHGEKSIVIVITTNYYIYYINLKIQQQ